MGPSRRMLRRMRSGLALALFIFGVAGSAHAQEDVCVEGRVATDETEGRCCWPGQHWSAEANRCEGVPECPEGRSMSGEDCVEDESGTGAPPPPPEAGTTAEDVAAPEESTEATTESAVVPAGAVTPGRPGSEERTQKNVPLLISGAASFGLGYVFSIVLAIASYQTACPDRPYFFFIPVVGGVMGAVNGAECGANGAFWLGLGASIVQVAGIVLFALGLIDRRVEDDGSVSLGQSVALVPSQADLGFGLRLSL